MKLKNNNRKIQKAQSNKKCKNKVILQMKRKSKRKSVKSKRLQIEKSKRNFKQLLDKPKMHMIMSYFKITNYNPKLKTLEKNMESLLIKLEKLQ